MTLRLLILAGVFAAPMALATEAGNVVVVSGATVIHPEREGDTAIERDATITIRDGRIESVRSSGAKPEPTEPPSGATVIDARGNPAPLTGTTAAASTCAR